MTQTTPESIMLVGILHMIHHAVYTQYCKRFLQLYITQGFEDEDVKVAERPKEPSAAEGVLGSLGAKVSQAINWVPEQGK
jgi:hypothetical protein